MTIKSGLSGTSVPGVYDRGNQAYSDSNPPGTLQLAELIAASVGTVPANQAVMGTDDGSRFRLKDDSQVTRTTAMQESANAFTGAQSVSSGAAVPLTLDGTGSTLFVVRAGGVQKISVNSSGDVTTAGAVTATGTVTGGEIANSAGLRLSPQASRLTSGVTSTVTTFADTGMQVSLFPGTYSFRARGQYRTAAATTGINLRMGGTLVSSACWYERYIYGLTASTYTHDAVSVFAASLTATTGVAVQLTNYGWLMEGTIVVTTAGTLSVQYATEVAASSAIVQTGSHLQVQHIG